MVEKNIKKENTKKYRVLFEGRLCTVEYKSKKHPERGDFKRQLRKEVSEV